MVFKEIDPFPNTSFHSCHESFQEGHESGISMFIDENSSAFFFDYVEIRPKKLEAILVIMSIRGSISLSVKMKLILGLLGRKFPCNDFLHFVSTPECQYLTFLFLRNVLQTSHSGFICYSL